MDNQWRLSDLGQPSRRTPSSDSSYREWCDAILADGLFWR